MGTQTAKDRDSDNSKGLPQKAVAEVSKGRSSGNRARLRAAQRRELLLEVASEVFFEQGYAATSLDEIISRAGGSRRSIYTEFGGKEGLFQTLMTERANRIVGSLNLKDGDSRELRAVLLQFGESMMSVLLAPATQRLARIVLVDGARFPELAKIFFENGPGRAAEHLASVLESAKKRGEISCANSRIAANQFIGMLRGNLFMQFMLRLRSVPKKKELKELVESAVNIFLRGIEVRPE
jgi:AcrR family transcriptional regulator